MRHDPWQKRTEFIEYILTASVTCKNMLPTFLAVTFTADQDLFRLPFSLSF